MNDTRPYSGQMTHRVKFYAPVTEKNVYGEPIETEELVSERFVMRIDGTGNEEEEGRLLSLGICTYRMRFDAAIFAGAGKMFVRDFDGDWQVIGKPRLLDGRRRYMELRCRQRGEA